MSLARVEAGKNTSTAMEKTLNLTGQLNSYIDHTLLKAEASQDQIEKVCQEAIDHQFAGVCIPPYYTHIGRNHLINTKVKLISVIGFPLGYQKISTKTEEAKKAIDDGAQELDMVMNIAAFKSESQNYAKEDIDNITSLCRLKNTAIKVIIETPLLNEHELQEACNLCASANVDYVKTCTGFNGPVSVDAVKMLKAQLPANIKIKASGGIRDGNFAHELIESGASRIGTSSGLKMI